MTDPWCCCGSDPGDPYCPRHGSQEVGRLSADDEEFLDLLDAFTGSLLTHDDYYAAWWDSPQGRRWRESRQ